VQTICERCLILKVLTLSDLPKLTVKSCESLAKATSKVLEHLDLSGSLWTSGFNYYLNDQLLKSMTKKFISLEEFHCNHCYFLTDFGIIALAEQCKQLKVLNLNHNSWMSNFAVKRISENCKFLKIVGLSCCSKLTYTSLTMLMKCCKNLKSLDVGGCKNMNTDGISLLLQTCSHMNCLNVYGIKVLDNSSGFKRQNSGHNSFFKRLKERYDLETLEFTALWYPLIR
jgi:hypothetical protein